MRTANNNNPNNTSPSEPTVQGFWDGFLLALAWGGMGLSGYGIPTTRVMYSTAIVVSFTVGFVNLLRQISTMKNKNGDPCLTWAEAIKVYYEDNHFVESGLAGLKTYCMVTGWTGGYEILAKYFGSSSFRDLLLRAVGSANLGTASSLTAEEGVNILQNDIYKKCQGNDFPESWTKFFIRHVSSLKIIPACFTASFLASVLVDLNLSGLIQTKIGKGTIEKIVASMLDVTIFATVVSAAFQTANKITQSVGNYCLSWLPNTNTETSLEEGNPQREQNNNTQAEPMRCGIL